MQPAFVVRDNGSCADYPYTWLALFDQHLPTGELFAKGDLAVGTNDFERGMSWERNHGFVPY
jgi:hypothetical protein